MIDEQVSKHCLQMLDVSEAAFGDRINVVPFGLQPVRSAGDLKTLNAVSDENERNGSGVGGCIPTRLLAS
jgi:hypothetical protein